MSTLVAELTPEYRFSPAPRFPRYCTSLLNRTCDLFWEARLGIHTTGGALVQHPDARHYGCLAYDTYFKIFNRLELQPADVVVDLGCGKGRVVCVAATHRVKEVIGVEIDPHLCALGRANGERMRSRRAPVRFVCQSAADFDFAPVNTVVLISPFGEATMEKTLTRIEQSLAARPRSLRIAYGNPVLSLMLAAKRWLRLYECWRPHRWSRVKFPVHFYRTVSVAFLAALRKLEEKLEFAAETISHCPV